MCGGGDRGGGGQGGKDRGKGRKGRGREGGEKEARKGLRKGGTKDRGGEGERGRKKFCCCALALRLSLLPPSLFRPLPQSPPPSPAPSPPQSFPLSLPPSFRSFVPSSLHREPLHCSIREACCSVATGAAPLQCKLRILHHCTTTCTPRARAAPLFAVLQATRSIPLHH